MSQFEFRLNPELLTGEVNLASPNIPRYSLLDAHEGYVLMESRYIRHGFGAVRPYIYGRLDMIDLIREAFGAEELERLPGRNGFHIEARIGDSMLVLEAAEPPPPGGTPSSIYVYVEDVDDSFRRAVELGATEISKPEDKPYQERAAGVKDRYGNTWWISTYTG